MTTFKELQKIITEKELYIWYDNDYWELRLYPMKMELTKKQYAECIFIHSDDVDFNTFPESQVYYGNCCGNGLMVLLANTPLHKIKGVEKA